MHPSPPSGAPPLDAPRPRTRALLAVPVLVVLVTGLAVSRGDGLAADLAGGALYAALVHLLVLLAVPAAHGGRAAAVALGVCVAVELAQLTPVPAAVGEMWPPAAYVLGSTFVATDLLTYLAGVLVVAGVEALTGRRRRRT
ncbi:DUF2809 domain-containing protein [Cellulomonas sp. Sa3CUA2]|uniref:DUF2809 domain-containing protein n=1 Tax=Cellulomonas avistercoris TaxID=2762242 RepID=A0ABR8Q8S1_9CELL|nr:DUF2809 domain-containing protein [Cellulomonas avistercoris]MBD7916821.1 DUF2809 domain-containing protein [Cellulomonas avistercoris]